eukprot:jgi/Mesvir1/12262/Mv00477-RA.1
MKSTTKAMSPDAELEELQKKYALLEGDRKAYYETSQWTIKQNRETMVAVKKENKDLRAQLAAMHTDRVRPKTDSQQEELEKMRQYVGDLRKKYDDARIGLEKQRRQIQQLQDGLRDLDRDLSATRAHEEDTPMTRHIRMLENRLDKALIKYNEAQSIRKTYEQIVKRLKEERVGFDNQLSAIEKTLHAKEKDLEELILMSHDAQHAKDAAKSELSKVDNLLLAERQQREKELTERRAQVKAKQEMTQKLEERERLRRGMRDSEEDTEAARKALASSSRDAQDKAAEAERGRIASYEEAFRKIKEGTGVSDVVEVIQKFMTQEDTNTNLRQMTKEAQARIDALVEEKNAAKARVEEVKYSGSFGGGSRRIVDEFEAQLAEAVAKCDRNRIKFERLAKILINMKAGIEHLSDKLEGIKIDQPFIPMSDETVPDVLQQCEMKALKMMDFFADDPMARRLLGGEDVAAVISEADEAMINNVRIGLSAATMADSDDEPGNGLDGEDDERDVPDRLFMKNTSQMMTERASRKGKKSRRFSSSPPEMPSTPLSPGKAAALRGKMSQGERPQIQ